MQLATVHKYSIVTEFPQDGAYRLVEMQHCRNSVELLHEMLNQTVKGLVRNKKKPEVSRKNILFLLGKYHIYIYRQVVEFNTGFLYCSLSKQILVVNRYNNVSAKMLQKKKDVNKFSYLGFPLPNECRQQSIPRKRSFIFQTFESVLST